MQIALKEGIGGESRLKDMVTLWIALLPHILHNIMVYQKNQNLNLSQVSLVFNIITIVICFRPPLHYGEGLWPWKCLMPSKPIQRFSHENSKIIYVWAWVVKCNVNWKSILLKYQYTIMEPNFFDYFMSILIFNLIFYVTFFITRLRLVLFFLHHFLVFFILASRITWIIEEKNTS